MDYTEFQQTQTKERGQIAFDYGTLRRYKDGVFGYVEEMLGPKEPDKQGIHEFAFYLNSSDPLESLMKLDLTGKTVLTVSGSGEFSHVFIHDGAKEVISYDISPAAAFYSELRHQALCNLSMEDYIKLFGDYINNAEDEDGDEMPFLNKAVFEKVRPFLSAEASQYFGIAFNSPTLINIDISFGNDFARVRGNEKFGYNRFIGDIITNPQEYKALQAKAKKVKFTQIICDVDSLGTAVKRYHPDMMYLSNIGYFPQNTFALAQDYVDQGIPEVVCTVAKNSDKFNDSKLNHRFDDPNGFYYQDKRIQPGDVLTFKTSEDKAKVSKYSTIQVIDTNRDAQYGLTFKVF